MTLSFELDNSSGQPLYRQLYAQLRDQILQGRLAPGAKLPPTRTLAERLGVSRITVTQAYDQLQAEGYAVGKRGAGTFIAGSLPLPEEDDQLGESDAFTPSLSGWGRRVVQMDERFERRSEPGRFDIDFGFGRSFPHIFPYGVWRRLLARYLSTDDAMLSRYGSVAGFHPLREAISDYLARLRGVHCRPEEVIVVNGAQQA